MRKGITSEGADNGTTIELHGEIRIRHRRKIQGTLVIVCDASGRKRPSVIQTNRPAKNVGKFTAPRSKRSNLRFVFSRDFHSDQVVEMSLFQFGFSRKKLKNDEREEEREKGREVEEVRNAEEKNPEEIYTEKGSLCTRKLRKIRLKASELEDTCTKP